VNVRSIFLPYSAIIPLSSLVVDDENGELYPCDATCNGHAIGAVRVDSMLPWRFGFPTAARAAGYQDVLSKPLRAPDASLPLAHLVEIVGAPAPSAQEPCPDCGGTGIARNAENGCTCANCLCDGCTGGKRWTRPPQRPIVLCGIGVNANLVACTLAAVDKDAGWLDVWTERVTATNTRVINPRLPQRRGGGFVPGMIEDSKDPEDVLRYPT
jgi:hypothetical protein